MKFKQTQNGNPKKVSQRKAQSEQNLFSRK